jgi:hypothetical protein
MRTNLAAYTAPGCKYPEFISINKEENGNISVTVRSPRKDDGSCGDIACIEMDEPHFDILLNYFQLKLDESKLSANQLEAHRKACKLAGLKEML